MKSKIFSLYNIVLGLIVLANFLNLFVPRFAEEDNANYVVRLPIQLTYVLILALNLSFVMFYKNQLFSKLLICLKILLLLTVGYLIMGVLLKTYPVNYFTQYLRELTWVSGMLFFIRYSPFTFSNGNKLMSLYVLLFLVVAVKKIVEVAMTVNLDERNGGDTTGLTVALIIPVILLYFKGNLKVILTGAAILLIFISLRRTAILALVLSSPFLYKEFKQNLKTYHIVLFAIFVIGASIYAWDIVGAKIIARFQELSVGDKGGSQNSYGSGRSNFYLITFKYSFDGSLIDIIFGHGEGGVRQLLKTKYEDIGHTHNDYLEVLYTFGLFGLCIWMGIVYQLVAIRKKIKKYVPHQLNIYHIGLTSFVLISVISGTLFKIEMLAFAIGMGTMLSEATKIQNMSRSFYANYSPVVPDAEDSGVTEDGQPDQIKQP